MIDHVQEIKKAWGLTVFLIEHDMEVVMNISDWIAVMNFGEKWLKARPGRFRRTPK